MKKVSLLLLITLLVAGTSSVNANSNDWKALFDTYESVKKNNKEVRKIEKQMKKLNKKSNKYLDLKNKKNVYKQRIVSDKKKIDTICDRNGWNEKDMKKKWRNASNPPKDKGKGGGKGNGNGTVGAPLDGGLLALLAGAGVAYFGARKKKKQQQ